jgi:type I restriction enzyme S subunit
VTEAASVGADGTLGTDLPPSWAVTTLGTVTDYGKTVKVEPAEIPADAWVLELEDIEKDSSRILQRLTQSQRQSLSTKNRFDVGDVLYGKLRPYLNKVVIADTPGFCTTEIVPVHAGPALERRYLFHWLKHPAFLKYVEATSHGMNMPRLGTDAGRAAPMVLAPRPEQTRIADQLDTLLARIQACQDRLEAIPALLKRFRQAVLGAATSGSLTADWRKDRETPAWVPTSIGDLLDGKPRNGYSPKSVEYETSVRSLTLSATTSGRFLSQHTKFIPESIPADSHLWLEPGDILIQRANTLEYVGVSAIFDGPPQSFIYPDLMMKCRPNNRVDGRFLYFLLSAESTRRYFRDHATGTAGNMPKINQQTVMSAPVNLPPMDEQVEIVRRANRLLHALSQLEQRHTAAAAFTRRLTPLTLAKAFRGELVPQDPSDEPASELLARIVAQRDAPTDTTSAPPPRRGRPPRALKETATMTKSRQDDDVMGQPYLAGHLRRFGSPASAEALFKVAELPVADFYKQLAWEVDQGHVKDNQTSLEPGHAAG